MSEKETTQLIQQIVAEQNKYYEIILSDVKRSMNRTVMAVLVPLFLALGSLAYVDHMKIQEHEFKIQQNEKNIEKNGSAIDYILGFKTRGGQTEGSTTNKD